MTGSPVREEVELLLFNPVFHVSARAVDFIVELLGVSPKIGHEVAGITSFGGVLCFANDESGVIPAGCFVVKPGEEALLFAGILKVRLRLLKDGLEQGGDALVASQSDEVVDVVLFTPTQHSPTAKAGVGTKNDAHFWPRLAESFDEYFQDGPRSTGSIGIGRAEQSAEGVATAKDVERQEAVSAIIMVVGRALLASVNEVVGGVEIEDDLVGSLGVAFDEEVDKQVGHAHRAVSISPLFHAAEGR